MMEATTNKNNYRLRKKHNPQRIKCPKCQTEGRLNQYNPKHDLGNASYVIVHDEYLPGYWGRKGKVQIRKRRRCYPSKEQALAVIIGLPSKERIWRDYERQLLQQQQQEK
jgi:hypothetical protein